MDSKPSLVDLVMLWACDETEYLFELGIGQGSHAGQPILKFYLNPNVYTEFPRDDSWTQLWVATLVDSGYIWTPFSGTPFAEALAGYKTINPADPEFFDKLKFVLDKSTKLKIARKEKEKQDARDPHHRTQ